MNRSPTNDSLTTADPEMLWTRDFVLLLASTLLLWCSFYLLLTTLPTHIVHDLGGTSTQVGLMSTLVSLVAMVARPITGHALDRFGRRAMHLGTLVLFAVLTLAYGLPGGLVGLLVVRGLNGIPFGAVTTATQTVAADLVPARRRGEGIGYYNLAGTVAMAVIPPLALYVLEHSGFATIVVSAVALSAGALMLALAIRHLRVRDPQARLSLSSLLEGRIDRLALTAMGMLFGYGATVSFTTLYAEELGLASAGWFFSLYSVGQSLARPVAGRAFDRRGPAPVTAVSLALLGLAYLMLGGWKTELAFLGAAGVLGVGMGALIPALHAMAVNVVPPERRGAANATLFSAIDLGIGVGSYVLGALADAVGSYAVTYQIAAGLLLPPTAAFFLWVMPRYEEQMAA
jgi:MFS family permease